MLGCGEPTPASRLTGAKVLVTEDDPVIALDLRGILQDLGCLVLGPVASVRDGLALLARERPHAALLDVGLLDGRATPLAEALAAAAVPFALMTGYAKAELDKAAFAAAPRLDKPFGQGAITAAALQLLGSGRTTPPEGN
jgi:CheY-like chemotaxis protein